MREKRDIESLRRMARQELARANTSTKYISTKLYRKAVLHALKVLERTRVQ
jgi:hypothetical protein